MKETEKFIPNYEKIQQYVLNKIKSGEYRVGDRIPSENELAQLFSVSRLTANKAIKEMSLMGILERTRGKGTFVSSEQSVSTASKAFVAAVKLNPTGSRKPPSGAVPPDQGLPGTGGTGACFGRRAFL
jgi:DNA-binding GntR family transcriptional regulator